MTQEAKSWCKSHADFHAPEDVTTSCYLEFWTHEEPVNLGRVFRNRGGRREELEPDAFDLGPGGNYGSRLVAGFDLEEGRS